MTTMNKYGVSILHNFTNFQLLFMFLTIFVASLNTYNTSLAEQNFGYKTVHIVLPIILNICFGCSLRWSFSVPETYILGDK